MKNNKERLEQAITSISELLQEESREGNITFTSRPSGDGKNSRKKSQELPADRWQTVTIRELKPGAIAGIMQRIRGEMHVRCDSLIGDGEISLYLDFSLRIVG